MVRVLGIAYLLLLPFTKLFYHSASAYAIQLPELVFLLLAIAILLTPRYRQALWSLPLDRLDWGVVVVVLSQIGAAVLTQVPWVNTAVWGLVYLAGLYFLLRTILRADQSVLSPQRLRYAILLFGGVLTATVCFSWLYLSAGSPGNWEVAEQKYLAGLGYLWRIEAFTMSPNMLMNMLALPLLLTLAAWEQHRTWTWGILLLVFVLAAISTASKSLVLLVPVGYLLLWPKLGQMGRWLGGMISIVSLSFFLFATKTVVLSATHPDPELVRQSYATTDTLFTTATHTVYASMHYRMNQEALTAFRLAPLTGIGPDQFIPWINTRKAAGLYPKDKLSYGPHSLYLGTLAESGLIGLGGLLVFLLVLWKSCRTAWQRAVVQNNGLIQVLVAYVLLWALDGLAMDTLHFRQFWWTLPFIAAYAYQENCSLVELRTRNFNA